MFPLQLESAVSHMGINSLYVATGFLFGFVLERAGFGNSRVLAAQFYLTEMRVLKVMFTAIITAMLLIFWLAAFGWLDYRSLYINPTHLWPGIVGGFIFGIGFVIGGYCPGTAIVSMATLKLDGLFFVLGLGIGMFLFGENVNHFRAWFDTSSFYGELTLPQWLGWSAGLTVLLAVTMALSMFWAAERVERYFAARNREAV
jgi:uncharacterized membrane protein YedE/YeeE